MSYILDALRRADAERDRGRVPGLHAQPAGGADDDDEPGGRGGMRWGYVAVVLGLSLIVVLAWLAFGRDKPIEVVVTTAPPPPVVAPVVQAAPAPAPAPVVPAPAPVAEPAPAVAADAEPAPPRPQRKTPPAKRETARAAASASAAEEVRVYTVAELPEDVRRELPALSISGATYSESRSNRMLIVNGQLLHEGDLVAPNLRLEQIRLKSAVLRYKSYRYSIGF